MILMAMMAFAAAAPVDKPQGSIHDDIAQLEAREAAEVKQEKAEDFSFFLNHPDKPVGQQHMKMRDMQKNSAKKELAEADRQADEEMSSEIMASYDSFGAPIHDTMESTANHEFEHEVMARSEREAEAADHTKIEAAQKQCLAQCMGAFHGTLRTCAKKCKN